MMPEPEGSSLYLEQSTTGPYPEPTTPPSPRHGHASIYYTERHEQRQEVAGCAIAPNYGYVPDLCFIHAKSSIQIKENERTISHRCLILSVHTFKILATAIIKQKVNIFILCY
jgi:hypothetical protein